MRATTIIRLAAQAGTTIEVRADRGPGLNKRPRREFLNKEVAKISKRGDLGSCRGSRILPKIRPIDPMLGQVLLLWDLCELLFKTLSALAFVELVP
jgi:hypothetical protein